jgi:hypothetical protein
LIVDDEEIVVRLHAHVCTKRAGSSFCELVLDQQLHGSGRERPAGVVFVDTLAEKQQSNDCSQRFWRRQPVASRNRLSC